MFHFGQRFAASLAEFQAVSSVSGPNESLYLALGEPVHSDRCFATVKLNRPRFRTPTCCGIFLKNVRPIPADRLPWQSQNQQRWEKIPGMRSWIGTTRSLLPIVRPPSRMGPGTGWQRKSQDFLDFFEGGPPFAGAKRQQMFVRSGVLAHRAPPGRSVLLHRISSLPWRHANVGAPLSASSGSAAFA
jgi:hypothetical protein